MAKNLINQCLIWKKCVFLNRNYTTLLTKYVSNDTRQCVLQKLTKIRTANCLPAYSNFQPQITTAKENKFLDRLKIDQTIQKRVNFPVLQEAIEFANRNQLTLDDGVFLLQCSAQLPDRSKDEVSEIIDSVWSIILKSGVPPKHLVKELIRSYRKIGKQIDDLYGFLNVYQCEADSDLLEEFLWLACENGQNSEGIVKILNEIKTKNYPLTLNMFNALILGHSRNKSIETCEKVLETIKLTNLQPNGATFAELIRAYIENGMCEQAKKLLNEKGSNLNQPELFSLLRSSELHSTTDVSKEIFKFIPKEILENKQISLEFRNICFELIHFGKRNEMLHLINQLPVPQFTDNEDLDMFGGFLINELIGKNVDATEIINLCQQLIKNGQNTRALHICCESALRKNSPDILIYFHELSKMEPLRSHYFWPLIIRSYAQNGEGGVLDILKKMQSMDVVVDSETVSNYILPRMNSVLKDPEMVIKQLEERGIKMNVLQVPVILFLLSNEKFDFVINILKTFRAKLNNAEFIDCLVQICQRTAGSKRNANLIGTIVKMLCDKNSAQNYDFGGKILLEIATTISPKKFDMNSFVMLTEQFSFAGVKISQYVCDILLQHIGKCEDVKLKEKGDEILRKMWDNRLTVPVSEELGSSINHPRDMTYEELECHLIELQSKNMNIRGRFSDINFLKSYFCQDFY